jgi:hypothetical protein
MAGCSLQTSAASYEHDDRLTFSAPAAYDEVKIPVTLSWRVDDFRPAAPDSEPPSSDAGYFAVFVDQAPVAPGDTLRAVANGDRLCNPRVGCPDKAYLEQRQVYTTLTPAFTLESLQVLSEESDRVQVHHVTVVLMDTAGRRISEGAWTLSFKTRLQVS